MRSAYVALPVIVMLVPTFFSNPSSPDGYRDARMIVGYWDYVALVLDSVDPGIEDHCRMPCGQGCVRNHAVCDHSRHRRRAIDSGVRVVPVSDRLLDRRHAPRLRSVQVLVSVQGWSCPRVRRGRLAPPAEILPGDECRHQHVTFLRIRLFIVSGPPEPNELGRTLFPRRPHERALRSGP